MNDEKRAALVEELAEAMYVGVRGDGVPREREEGAPTWAEAVGRQHAVTVYRRLDALAIMPIIDRLLASRDIDTMLDAVHPEAMVETWLQEAEPEVGLPAAFIALLRCPGATFPINGCGPTRTSAIANACRKAREGVR